MTALRVDSIDFDTRRFDIHRTDEHDGGTHKDGTPKNHKRRTVPFPSSLVPELQELTKNKAPGDRVFQSDRGKMTLDTYADLFDSDLDRMGTEIDSLIRKNAAQKNPRVKQNSQSLARGVPGKALTCVFSCGA